MNKVLAGAGGVLLLYAGSLWYSRGVAEESVGEVAGYLSSFPGYIVTAGPVEHSLSGSRAVLNLKLDTDLLVADPGEDQAAFAAKLALLERGIDLQLDIRRGPLVMHEGVHPALYRTIVTLDEDSALLDGLLGPDFNPNDYFSLLISMGYFGKGEARLDIVGLERSLGATRLEWGGMTQVLRLSDYGRSFELAGVLQPMVVNGANGSMETAALELSGAGQLPPAGSMVSNGTIGARLPYLSVAAGGTELLRMADMGLYAESRVDAGAGLFSFGYGLVLGAITGSMVPEPVNHFRLGFGVEGLNIEAVQRLYDIAMNLQNSSDPARAQAQAIQALSGLLQGNPAFVLEELDFSLGQDKALSLSARLRPGENFGTALAVAMFNPEALLNTVEVDVSGSVTQPLLMQLLESRARDQLGELGLDPASEALLVDQQVRQMGALVLQAVQAGFLVQEGDSLVFTASLSQGTATLNGVPVPLMSFL